MKAIIFDMDGLMIDSEKLYIDVEKMIAQEYRKDLSDDVFCAMMGRKPLESMQIFVDALGVSMSPEAMLHKRDSIMEQKLRTELEPMKGLYEIIHAFHGKLALAISTGAPQKFLDLTLDRLNIRDKFAVLQPSDTIRNGKPDPEIYQKTIQQLACDSQECVVLEDSYNGALAGKRAGCYVIAVPSEHTASHDFSCADYTAKDLLDARDHINLKLQESHIGKNVQAFAE